MFPAPPGLSVEPTNLEWWAEPRAGSTVVSSVCPSLSQHAVASTCVSLLPPALAVKGYQHKTKLYLKDLDDFNVSLTGPLALAWQCLAVADLDLKAALGHASAQSQHLVEEAEKVCISLSSTACRISMTVLPSLRLATMQAEVSAVGALLFDADKALMEIRKEAHNVRLSYVDLLKYLRYVIQCTQVALDGCIIQTLEAEGAAQDPVSAQAVEENLTMALSHLDDACALLADCSDFWLMLHGAELGLGGMEKEAHRLRRVIGTDFQAAKNLPEVCAEFINQLVNFCQEHHAASTTLQEM